MADHPTSSLSKATQKPPAHAHVTGLRPLVRYVDESQAILEFRLHIDWPGAIHDAPDQGLALELLLRDPQGQHIRLQQKLAGVQGDGVARFELPAPQRWWPASMGEQPLYDATLRLIVDGEPVDIHTTTLGLSSVRSIDDVAGPSLLVHGQPCSIQQVIQIQPVDEKNMIPAGDGALMIVRQHFGTETLYNAADRAGILLIQAIPVDAMHAACKQDAVFHHQIGRVASHPSLAGWLVDRSGQLAQRVADHLHELDPTRAIFRQLPGLN